MMSLIVSGLSTAIAAGVNAQLPGLWLGAWPPSWVVAFPTVLVAPPVVRRILGRIMVDG